MVLQYAHHIAADSSQPVEVRAVGWVALNGRRSAPLIDPEIDLTTRHDGLAPYDWVFPAPQRY